MRRIGILLLAKQDQAAISPFLRGFEGLGYVEGKNVVIDYRDAEGKDERLPEAADELVRLNPDVIFSFGGEQAPIVKKATATIPIVVVVSNDPVESGLVASLGRPGGNITGVTWVHDQLAGKSVELLKDTAPWVSRVAILWNPNHADPEFRETQRASRTLGVQLQSLEVREAGDYEAAFRAAEHGRAEALIVIGSRLMNLNRQRIGDFAAKNRLIMVGVPSWLMEVGALLTYGPNVAELSGWAATYVDKILKGARPADLPMQQPTRFELAINLKTAPEESRPSAATDEPGADVSPITRDAQSTLIPADAITLAHLFPSEAMKPAKSAGVPGRGSTWNFARLAFIVSDRSPSLITRLRRKINSAGVPAGASTPVQNVMTKSG